LEKKCSGGGEKGCVLFHQNFSQLHLSLFDPFAVTSWLFTATIFHGYPTFQTAIFLKTAVVTARAGHNFGFPLISPLFVDPLINGTVLIFHFENVNLTEECLFLNLFKASVLKIRFYRIL
jgi:hypothetical protein